MNRFLIRRGLLEGVRISFTHLLLQVYPFEVTLELAEEYLSLAIDLNLADGKQILANYGFTLHDDVVTARAKVSLGAYKFIFGFFVVLKVDIVCAIEKVDHAHGNLLELLQIDVKPMIEHEFDNLEDFESHHVFASFKHFLHTLCL